MEGVIDKTSSRKLPPSARIKKRREFLELQDKGRKFHCDLFVLVVASNKYPYPRLGITVSRRCDKRAVQRNLLKRRVRDFFRNYDRTLLGGLDLVLIAKTAAVTATYQEFERRFSEVMVKVCGRSVSRGG